MLAVSVLLVMSNMISDAFVLLVQLLAKQEVNRGFSKRFGSWDKCWDGVLSGLLVMCARLVFQFLPFLDEKK